ncbi:MAG: hypothetical protein E7370_02965 [Clostridiales bacterium]|nr:hypothetical protein [Clostridiales bacterium]
MSEKLTAEQSQVVSAQGKIIVSASAGSGKTFVMIKKLGDYIQNGGDLDSVLAVTFTKKAAAQMKEKLRSALIERLPLVDAEEKRHIKAQLNKISTANVSTIHSFCAHLLRTYFYLFDFEGSFEVIFDDDPITATLKSRAMEELFARLYEEDDEDLLLLLSCFTRKRKDSYLKDLILVGFNAVKNTVNYRQTLKQYYQKVYSEQSFNEICAQIQAFGVKKIKRLRLTVDKFLQGFKPNAKEAYQKLFDEIYFALDCAQTQTDIFAPLPPLTTTRKHKDKEEDLAWGEYYKDFKEKLKNKYDGIYGGIKSREEELNNFMQSGKIAQAYCNLLAKFDEEYGALKREEGKMDCADLEHYTLALLQNEQILSEIQSRFTQIYIDEYQDVNPVQEKILSTVATGNVLQVGDVKQAIYGFRGSKSKFFAQKYQSYQGGEGQALTLSSNFRSADGVIDFVNDLFSSVMQREDGIDYKNTSLMQRGGFYPQNTGYAKVQVFGKDDAVKPVGSGIYSVLSHKNAIIPPSREALAVLKIVQEAEGKEYYDLKDKGFKRIEAKDICLLSRKGESENVLSIVRTLTQAGYPISGTQDSNLCNRPEIKKLIDILSFIENSEQDVPLVTAMLSPIGGFTENELAKIKIYGKAFEKEVPKKQRTYRRCCHIYAEVPDYLGQKIKAFYKKIDEYKSYADLFGASSLIDKIMEDTLWEAQYAKNGGMLLKNCRHFASQARGPEGELSLCAFMQKLKARGFKLSAPEDSSSDGIKLMTMHASKGLEFPIVILCDLTKTFKGKEESEIIFDDELGFIFKSYNKDKMILKETLLWRLGKLREKEENLKNEKNLYYVACTRAMYGLHLLVSEVKPYNAYDAGEANCYVDMADLSYFSPEEMLIDEDNKFELNSVDEMVTAANEEIFKGVRSALKNKYLYEESVNLPVKTSASQILKGLREDELNQEYFLSSSLYEEEGQGETSIDAGVAYHKFLQLCSFEKRSEEQIKEQLDEFVREGKISAEQNALLSVKNLCKILSIPVFSKLNSSQTWREREFLCRLPANEILPTSATDPVLVQGAIDLLAQTPNGYAIVDYKYSKKSAKALRQAYAPQLDLYKKAVALILKVDESTISTTIINIFSCEEISL